MYLIFCLYYVRISRGSNIRTDINKNIHRAVNLFVLFRVVILWKGSLPSVFYYSIISIAFQQNFGNYLVLFSQIAVERIYKRFTATLV